MMTSLSPPIASSLTTMLDNWNRMQKSDRNDAETDAEQFEASFYAFIEQVSLWFNNLEKKPSTLEDAMSMPTIQQITQQLPSMLYLNFETELDFLIDRITREDDEKYD